jgi:cytosine/adenosine deaminase-related metal-dependent hydrolase
MTSYRADWLLPIVDAPVRDGWVALSQGRITGVGQGASPEAVDLGRAVVMPGLVNAHTHLELSYLHGRVPPAQAFTDWVRVLMALRRGHPDPASNDIVARARAAIAEARACGTSLVGDVSNTLITVPLLRDSGMPAHVFQELLGFNPADADARLTAAAAAAATVDGSDVRVTLAPHAPYSVSPALFRGIRAHLDAGTTPVTTVHLGESAEEIELLERGTGPLRTLLEDLGVWTDEWKSPGVSPVGYLSELGFLDRWVLAVHGVQFDGGDLSQLAACGAAIASCPRSNVHVGVGSPPLEAFYAMDVDVAFGTDSLASVADLNVFSELREARRIAPRVPARRLLESATLSGARALGRGDDFGSVEIGKRAALIAVQLPAGVDDVEEYLVGGIEPDAIRWLDD